MTKQEAVNIFISLQKLGNLTGSKFTYAISRNVNALKDFYKKYEEDRVALCESYAKKGEDGKAMKELIDPIKKELGERYVFENEEEFQKELKKFGEEPADIKLYKIDLKDVPENITAGQMVGISELINEPETKPE
jgi:hypothetical protein